MLFHGGEILTIDPNQVHRTSVVLAGSFFRENARHGFDRVSQFHMSDLNTKLALNRSRGPRDISVNTVIATPRIPEKALSPRFGDRGCPSAFASRASGQAREGESEEHRRCQHFLARCVHAALPLAEARLASRSRRSSASSGRATSS